MDHLKEAKDMVQAIHDSERLWHATTQPERAIAHALVSIAESLRCIDVAMVNAACLLEEIRDVLVAQEQEAT